MSEPQEVPAYEYGERTPLFPPFSIPEEAFAHLREAERLLSVLEKQGGCSYQIDPSFPQYLKDKEDIPLFQQRKEIRDLRDLALKTAGRPFRLTVSYALFLNRINKISWATEGGSPQPILGNISRVGFL